MRPGLDMDGDQVRAGIREILEVGSAGAIIRCVSNSLGVARRIALMIGAPKEMLGTKCPSITSICTQSALRPSSR